MTFNLFWIDFWLSDHLFGFGLCCFKTDGWCREAKFRNLFSIYWNDKELMIDLFWFRIVTHVVLIGYKEKI
ncbi:hypothetical protein LCGC14_2996680 [marine sediment metagenome]|uniref:Uncharacterized protein n=1 Tax=marine sediment metagenome TaxID=412755 RepID=A0A0F8X270_9ZZZZ